MSMTITGRQIMYVGGFRVSMFAGEHAVAAQATDDTQARMGFLRGGCSVCPISTVVGAGDMTVSWTNGTRFVGAALISMSNATITEVGSFMAWGW